VNVLVGYAGLASLGHAGLFGMAAYAGAQIMNASHGHAAVAVGALAVTLVASTAFPVLALRGTGLGFVMIKVALGQIVWGVAYRWISLTNRDNGISIRGRPSPLGLSLASPAGSYWATLAQLPHRAARQGRFSGARAAQLREISWGGRGLAKIVTNPGRDFP